MSGVSKKMYVKCFSSVDLYFFFFNDTATTESYTLSLHDALPICPAFAVHEVGAAEGRSPEAAPSFRCA